MQWRRWFQASSGCGVLINRITSEGKGIIASDSFAQIHQLKMGDVVELPTPSGMPKLHFPIRCALQLSS
jgi:hypothetical protein